MLENDKLSLTKDLIKLYEGCILTPYRDTKGVLTIGYGFNLDEGITKETAEYLLDQKIIVAKQDCRKLFANFGLLSKTRKAVLINMAYNMGRSRLSSFKKMIAAIERYDFVSAADEMLDSKWHRKDVGQRAVELSKLMRENKCTYE